ncbi:PH domain-containing protein [Arcanobacterium wilhelmae]|uniref:PH domain-containing protein n=1 Tax=Arcanobacterium wilhelmae TaxID=1803177 RepID=UPI00241586A1|nr:PH domain-containing protein [Arcanobacterium wilhelmae]WFN90019.1 PH domain-containing protein [Arcanobacterium wilhelmae]
MEQVDHNLEAANAEIAEDSWRHFHKVTPITKGTAIWVFVAIIFYNIVKDAPWEKLRDIHPDAADLWFYLAVFVGGLLVVSTLAVAAGWVVWTKQSFALVENGIHYRSGVFIQTRQHMLWERIQSVEIDQSLFGRIFGFGTVVVDSAAAGDRQLRLGLLTMADCAALRHELLTGLTRKRTGLPVTSDAHVIPDAGAQVASAGAELVGEESVPGVTGSLAAAEASVPMGRAAGGVSAQPAGSESTNVPGAPASAIPVFDPDDLVNDHLVYELNPWKLMATRLVSWQGFSALAYLIFTVWITVETEGASFGIILTALGIFYAVIKPAFTQWDTKVYISEHGLRVRSGLTSIRTITVPPERVHAITVSQTWLARACGWWSLDVTVAGRTTDDVKENLLSGVPVMPVGTIEDLQHVMWVLRPDLGSENDGQLFAELTGTPGEALLPTTKAARLFDPFQWGFRGFAATPAVVAIRSKRVGRSFAVIPQDRWQSCAITQGPWQARRGLASLRIDLVGV